MKEHNIRRFSKNNYRVAISDPDTGEERQEYFYTLSAARAWRNAEQERLLAQQKIQKAASIVPIRDFPGGICSSIENRYNKAGNIITYYFVRSTLHLNTGERKTHRAKYGDNRTVEEALALVLEKRNAFVKANPALFSA